jgi:hypothetical protein
MGSQRLCFVALWQDGIPRNSTVDPRIGSEMGPNWGGVLAWRMALPIIEAQREAPPPPGALGFEKLSKR